MKRVQSDEGWCSATQPVQRLDASVTLPKPGRAVVAYDFDDGAQRMGLMDTLAIQQWPVGNGDRSEVDFGYAHIKKLLVATSGAQPSAHLPVVAVGGASGVPIRG